MIENLFITLPKKTCSYHPIGVISGWEVLPEDSGNRWKIKVFSRDACVDQAAEGAWLLRPAATIRYRISSHPGHTPVILHFQNSAGKRTSLQSSGIYHVERSTETLQALDRFMEE
jgi:hypothetical protein